MFDWKDDRENVKSYILRICIFKYKVTILLKLFSLIFQKFLQ